MQRVEKYCEAHGMLEQGDRVLLGVSGGADSVCLLFLLHEMQRRRALSLRVVHVNHGIREEAGEDAAFVEELCRRLQIPFTLESIQVKELAGKEGLSEEEAGRRERYRIFEQAAAAWIAEDGGATGNMTGAKAPDGAFEGKTNSAGVKIALAHHAGDRAETLLFHLFRGSGLKGLASIPPMRETGTKNVSVIRPLLCLEREEIEACLLENGLTYCQDRTNFEDAYARNRIRHHVLPYAEQEICSGAIRHVNQVAEMLAETEAYLAGETEKAMARCVEEASGIQIRVQDFLREPDLIQKRILMEALRKLSPEHRDLGAVHVEETLDLFAGETGRSIDLPFGIQARREYDKIVINREMEGLRRQKKHGMPEKPSALRGGTVTNVDVSSLGEQPMIVEHGGKQFEFQSFFCKKPVIIPQKNYTKWFDYDKIKDTLSIRNRKTGDFLTIKGPDGRAVKKSLKDYFITEKLPQGLRDEIPLLTMDQQVLWIPGYRISESFKVGEETKTILQVRLLGTDEES